MTDRKRRTRRAFDLAGYREVLPGVWEPADMAEAEKWKRQQAQRRRRKETR